MIDSKRQREWLDFFSALASDARLKIVTMLSEQEMGCQEIFDRLNLSQPAISYHLGKLERAGILIKEKTGARNCYRLSSRISGLIKILNKEEAEWNTQ